MWLPIPPACQPPLTAAPPLLSRQEEINNTLPYDAQQLPDITEALKDHDKPQEKVKQEPLPEVPPGPMSVDQAYEFLGVPQADRGQLEKVKMRFRKLSLKYHPDKNIGREEAAAEVFKAVNAAYHTLTTNNFDYKRWAEGFIVPPLQTLEEVLMMALKGEDPMKIEIMLQKRGEYRPHQEFGINLAVPWSAGTKSDPSYDVSAGSMYTTTQGLEDKTRAELGHSGGPSGGAMVIAPLAHQMVASNTQDLIDSLGEKAKLGADIEARPWEAAAYGQPVKPSRAGPASTYQAPAGRPDLSAGSKEAKTVAEEYNDRAVQAFKDKHWQLVYDLASEAIRLNPNKVAYLGNRAAAGLKLGQKRHLRQAAEDSVMGYELDPAHMKSWHRAAQAHLALNERATVKLSIKEYEKALELAPDNKKIKEEYKDACLTWEADFE